MRKLLDFAVFKRLMMLLKFLLTLVLFWSGCSGGRDRDSPPAGGSAVKTPVPVPKFDAHNAFRYLAAQVDFGPRVSGTKAHDLCRDFLAGEMGKSAEAVNLQPFTIRGYDGNTLKYT
ncbi:MAG TPA: hypothetical protein VI932_07560, partial [Bacteroidota bacterium]|nr:hypothetical protein [Bacteroidota bacterium]